jgi:2-desacetyl-2-hydroxyethyl bacteriochlorophyllide A dehydrogenase
MAARTIDREAIVITAPLEAQLKSSPIETDGLGENDLLVETEYSVISAGTELSIYKGIESWAPLPFIPGYGSVGKITETGSRVTKFAKGDRVFAYGNHASFNIISDGVVVKAPDKLAGKIVPVAARIGQVAMTALRVSSAELGDIVTVQGLGLVGNIAAQLFKLSGCTVIGVDVSDKRLAAAKACGIDHLINSSKDDVLATVNKLTDGARSRVVVEATGIPSLIRTAVDLAGKGGEVILLGTPRGVFEGNARDLLMKVHEASTAVTLKGAHEWIYPVLETAGIKHSMERNVKQLLNFAAEGRLHIDELISHVVSPAEVPNVYKELYNRNEDYFGVVIDWTKIK